ncbi:MAG TPA: PorV/PorQ family protein [candidate division Zixibacteria bacterium]|nr:PorV/PorQ family protein [candidate division Zixibacteria bacterium]MDD4916718.1 PorV/PorQ family protein [candidate division Zixibacteria bacterium]MDM7972580.1 PorV/PorQ family protein [candidate division Zixibacteria bacterium]HPI31713.1 PorV/PorQ family protein [candidate division Zixibacteria bacterium]HPM37958.1 PorV/PorQ family protein [candidate division Zixibacteria bacterium]
MTRTLYLAAAGCAVALLLSAAGAAAGEANSRAGTSAFSFLKIDVGARAVAMGGAGTGLADDESALYYNPAGIVGFEQRRFVGGYHSYFADMQSGFVGYIAPIGLTKAVGAYLSYLNYGDFVETDPTGAVLGTFSGGDLLFAVSGAVQPRYGLALGATVKFIYESLHNYTATGAAVDLGGRYSTNRDRLIVGLAVQHLGVQFSGLGTEKDRLPLTVRGGAALRPRGLPLTLAGDLIVPVDNDPSIALGLEYVELKPLYLRIGWNSFGSNYRTGDSDDSWAGLGLGVGFDIKTYHISYAFAPGAELGDSHRFTFSGGI